MGFSTCRDWIADSNKIVGFSGAGISTASGIPDFRSPDGIWAKNRTVTFQEFVANEEDRIEYWRQKSLIWPEMRKAKPNKGHLAFVHLAEQGKFLGMITQNIERLHQKAGLTNEQVVELHGTTTDVACLDCKKTITMDEACARIQKGELAPVCKGCGGFLKPATISFGQQMPFEEMKRANDLCQACDIFIAVGSSLVVHPAASFPLVAKQSGAKLIIINRDETPMDSLADAVFHDEIDRVLPALLEMVEGS